MIRPFDPVAVERDMKAKKFKTRELENAVRQALDPSLLEEEEQEDEEEEEEDEEEEEEEVVTTTTKKTTRGRSKASSTAKNASAAAKKKTAPKRSKSRSKDEEEEEVESSPAKAKRRSRKLEESDKDAIHETDTGRKKRVSWGVVCAAYTRVCGRDGRGSVCHAKTYLVDFFFSFFQRKSVSSSDKEEGRVSPAASQRNTSGEPEKPKDEASEYDKERMRMYRLRHKLQKLVYQKKPVSGWKQGRQVIKESLMALR